MSVNIQNNKNKCYVVPVQKTCNLRCFFCSTKIYPYNKQEIMVIDEKFFKNILMLKKKRTNYFEITGGGEPFLNPQLQEIIDKIRENFPQAFIKLYTNGRIRHKYCGIDELNISAVHWDEKVVQAICGGYGTYSLIETLSYFRDNYSNQIRLSIPMLNKGIGTAKQAKYIIEITKKYVDKYVFRPMNTFVAEHETMSASFELDMKNVEIDKEFCSCNEIDLWFSDNELYRKWDLSI